MKYICEFPLALARKFLSHHLSGGPTNKILATISLLSDNSEQQKRSDSTKSLAGMF